MNICILTPTRNRPAAFALLRGYVRSQDLAGHRLEWLVVNDGEPYDQAGKLPFERHIRRTPRSGEGHSLCMNVAAGLDAADADIVAFMEDDDYYAPDYLRTLLAPMLNLDLAMIGFNLAHYYHVPTRTWRCAGNRRHASLAETAIRDSLIDATLGIAAYGKPFIDLALWRVPCTRQLLSPRRPGGGLYHLGMKGLPGEPGIGSGHREQHRKDADGRWLRAQVGAAADAYLSMEATSGQLPD